ANTVRPHLSCPSNFSSANKLDVHLVRQPKKSQHQRYDNHGITPPNGTSISVKQKLRRSTTILKLQQILNTGERCSPLQRFGKFYRRKIAPLGGDFYFVLVHNSGQLCPFLTPHSSFKRPLVQSAL
ncbi:hypothetical protein, partial [Ruminococcus sp.]|uniref:hypothetical protein n=1 Tax=Ruminococcus sp. TaxID=41978 RepID=UPI003FF04F1D